ncbi:hypothetical protein LCGC14_1376980 [marine sediment metagenome]|uniref:AP2/ERF domain-containing protein n=1 Tax=marine sediment metagenome TaxID=412755 RepID=A0A0F9KPP2_9ZZZZ
MPDGYAVQASKYGGRRIGRMHNMLLSPPRGMEADHINGNGLDNRRRNLRVVTRAQQCMNRRPQGKSSKYKGVCRYKGRWHARIKINGHETHLGYFKEERYAAAAYNQAAQAAFGEFAWLNPVKDFIPSSWLRSVVSTTIKPNVGVHGAVVTCKLDCGHTTAFPSGCWKAKQSKRVWCKKCRKSR